ncbi:siderophore-interacting FAD-binding domain protein, partial [Vibrio parahaemolyticus V-223/04]
KVRR